MADYVSAAARIRNVPRRVFRAAVVERAGVRAASSNADVNRKSGRAESYGVARRTAYCEAARRAARQRSR